MDAKAKRLVGRTFLVIALVAMVSPDPAEANHLPKNLVTPALHCMSDASTSADFNGDGVTDVAIGSPFYNDGVKSQAGAINVAYGAATGVPRLKSGSGIQTFPVARAPNPSATDLTDQFLLQGDFKVAGGGGGLFKRFGYSLASGNFNGDGPSDLAIGIPGDQVTAGAVMVVYGRSSGFHNLGATTDPNVVHYLHQGIPGVPGSNLKGDNLGFSLAAGDFDGDGTDDLAVGAPGKDISAVPNSGFVVVFYGADGGLLPASAQGFKQGDGLAEVPERDDMFGSSLAAGDANEGDNDDLAIGVPHEDHSGDANAGLVHVVYSSGGGLTASGDQLFDQSDILAAVNVEPGDLFGCSLAFGDFDVDPLKTADLAIGAPGETLGSASGTGVVGVIYGSSGGLDTNAGQLGDGAHSFDLRDLPGMAIETNAHFGQSLRAANVDGETGIGGGFAFELTVGAPGKRQGANQPAGAVFVVGGIDGFGIHPQSNNTYSLSQDTSQTPRSSEGGDRFGESFGWGDFDGDDMLDLVAMAPGDSSCDSFNEFGEWISLDPNLEVPSQAEADATEDAGAGLVLYGGAGSATSTDRPSGTAGPLPAFFGIRNQTLTRCDFGQEFDSEGFQFYGLSGEATEGAKFGWSLVP